MLPAKFAVFLKLKLPLNGLAVLESIVGNVFAFLAGKANKVVLRHTKYNEFL